MAQLHFYVPNELAERLQEKASQMHLTLSRYLAELVKREMGQQNQWPAGYFEQVFGQWEGKPLQRPSQDEYEQRLVFK